MPLIQGKTENITNDNLSIQTANNLFVNVIGDQMSGDLLMNNHKIIGLSIATSDSEAANKIYVDNKIKENISLLKTEIESMIELRSRSERSIRKQSDIPIIKIIKTEFSNPDLLSPYIILTSPETEKNLNTGNISVLQISLKITHTNNIVDNTFYPLGSSSNKDYISITYGVNNLVLMVLKEIKQVKVICIYIERASTFQPKVDTMLTKQSLNLIFDEGLRCNFLLADINNFLKFPCKIQWLLLYFVEIFLQSLCINSIYFHCMHTTILQAFQFLIPSKW